MKIITVERLDEYRKYLYKEEKSANTLEKYMRDLRALMEYMGKEEVTKERMIAYKDYLLKEKGYKVTSINSFIVAANGFFRYMEWYGINVKTLKVQEEVFYPAEKELTKSEYKKLVQEAKRSGNIRLAMIIQTICATGIRVSELSAVTLKSVKKGVVEVNNKGKIRKVLIHNQLRRLLLAYAAKNGIKGGMIFRTRTGKEIHRNNIWRDMKKLCETTFVDAGKVFPHNLRRLFARTFYKVNKDLAKLAGILGHSSMETTRIYLRSSSREYQKQLDLMGLVC